MKTTRNLLAMTVGVALLASGFPNTAQAQPYEFYEPYEPYEDQAGAITADVLIYRPAGLILTVLGTAVFIVALPVTAISGGTGRAANTLVVAPFETTFCRPIGTDMQPYIDEVANPGSD